MTDRPSSELRIGVAGSGGDFLAYARAFAQIEGARVCAAVAPAALALELAKGVPGLRSGHDALALVTSADIDAVVLADALRDPYSLIKKALFLDKHVLANAVPAFLSSEQMRELAQLAARRSRVLMVAEERLFHPALAFLRRMLSERSGFWRFRYLRVLAAPGMGSQVSAAAFALEQIALVRRLVESPPESVNAVACHGASPIEPAALFIALRYSEGRVAFVQVSMLEVHEARQWAFATDSKTILVDENDGRAPLRIVSAGPASASGLLHLNPPVPLDDWASESSVTPPVVPVNMKAEQCRHFVSAASKDDASLGNADFWSRVIATWERAQESMEQAGAAVAIPWQAAATASRRPRLRIIQGRGTGVVRRGERPSLTLVTR